MNIKEHVKAYVGEKGLDCAGGGWVLAVSGGLDSMVLLDVVAELVREKVIHVERLVVGHVNHCLRGDESDGDEAFVIEQCKRLGIEVVSTRIDVGAVAKEKGLSIEVAAREERYRFLAELAQGKGCSAVAVAHHGDDQVETILYRLIRGTGVRGLAGMAACRALDNGVNLVRPMLGVRREEIEQYAKGKQIAFRDDKSNASDAYMRNRVRRELLPMLRERFNPAVDEAVLQLGEISGGYDEAIQQYGAKAVDACVIEWGDGRCVIDAERLGACAFVEQGEVINHVLIRLGAGLREVGYRQMMLVLDLLAGKTKGTVELAGGVTVWTKEGLLVIELRKTRMQLGASVELVVPGKTEVGGVLHWYDENVCVGRDINEIQAEVMDGGIDIGRSFWSDKAVTEEMIDLDGVQGDLVLREWQRGERFEALGAPGEKTMGDFLTDCKVPVQVRGRLGMVCDDAGVIWVCGVRIADRVRVSEATKRVLKLRIQ